MKKSDDKDLVKIAVEFEIDMKNISLSISNFIENYRYEKHMQNNSIFTEDFNKALQALKLRIVKEEKELYAACKNCLVKKKNY